MSIINFSNTRQMEGILNEISQVKELIESKINLSRTVDREKRASLTTNKVMRICFIVGLSLTTERKEEDYKGYTAFYYIGTYRSEFLYDARFIYLVLRAAKIALRQSEYRLVAKCRVISHHCR